MREVIIQIPSVEAEQNIEIDVKINGIKKTLKYRVEVVDWKTHQATKEQAVTVLQQVIRDYDKDWELVQIGAATKDNIPIMFRKKIAEGETNGE